MAHGGVPWRKPFPTPAFWVIMVDGWISFNYECLLDFLGETVTKRHRDNHLVSRT